jgi:hypothetical protein
MSSRGGSGYGSRVTDEAEPGTRVDWPTRYAQIASGWFVMLGIIGLLFTGFGEPRDVFRFYQAPLTSVIYIAIGLIGIPMATRPGTAARFSIGLGVVLILWALTALALGGSPAVFTNDRPVIAMQLVFGLAGLASGLLGARLERTSVQDAADQQ